MARSLGERLKELRRVVQLHTNWFTVALLGRDAISETELQELEAYGKLPLDEPLDFVKKSYILGRLRATLKGSEYKHLNYEAVDEQAASASFTTLEEYALQHVKLHAAEGIKGLAADLAAGAFDRLKASTQATVNEASVRGIIRDQLAIAIIEKQNSQQLASTLAKELKTSWYRDWRMIAETELHRAKMMGSAQAIVNKLGVYKNSDGVDSLVSIVPSPTRCGDCGHHFTDARGNPRVFRLSQLLEQGTNAEPDVKHTRSDGLHNHWKTTLPPLHPRCGCRIVYIPRGMAWESGKLQIVDKSAYVEELKKAVDTGSMSAVIKPPGPKSAQGSASVESAVSPPSMPGAPAPGNMPGPGAPPKAGGIDQLSEPFGSPSGAEEKVNCQFGGGAECLKNGGTGAKTHNADGESVKNHRAAKLRGAVATDPEAAAQDHARQQEDAKNWSRQGQELSTKLDHLGTGDISHFHTVSEGAGAISGMSVEDQKAHAAAWDRGELGVSEAYRVTIDGNGRGLMKPSRGLKKGELRAESIGDGVGCSIPGADHKREAAGHKMGEALMPGFVPATTTRDVNGRQFSVQAWQEDAGPVRQQLKDDPAHSFKSPYVALMDIANAAGGAEAERQMRIKLNDIAVFDMIINNGDRHTNNLMMPSVEEMTNVCKRIGQGEKVDIPISGIDSGASNGTGMRGHKNMLAKQMNRSNDTVEFGGDMRERAQNMSIGDMGKMLGGDLEDWEVGQNFMRIQYMAHLQDTEGHIDYEKIGRGVLMSVDGTMELPREGLWKDAIPTEDYMKAHTNVLDAQGKKYEKDLRDNVQVLIRKTTEEPDNTAALKELKETVNKLENFDGFKDMRHVPTDMRSDINHMVSSKARTTEYSKRAAAGSLPNQMFESFCKDWMAFHAGGDGPHSSAAKQLQETGIFMGPGFAADHKGYRRDGKHTEYADSISRTNDNIAPVAGEKKEKQKLSPEEMIAQARGERVGGWGGTAQVTQPSPTKPKVSGAPSHSPAEATHRGGGRYSQDAFADTLHAQNRDDAGGGTKMLTPSKLKKSVEPRLYLDLTKGLQSITLSEEV